MDTSTSNSSLGYVLNGKVVESQELTPAEWIELIQKVMAQLNPLLKYIPDFVDLNSQPMIRNLYFKQAMRRKVSEMLGTDIRFVAVTSSTRTHTFGPRPISHLFLTRDGRWFEISVFHEVIFRWIVWDDLQELIADGAGAWSNTLGITLLDRLIELVESTCAAQQRRLTTTRSLENQLRTIRQRIQ